MNRLKYTVVVEPLPAEEGGGFVATVPDLPGCMSDGETPEQALANVQDAITTWIEAAKDLGHSVPKPSRRMALTRLTFTRTPAAPSSPSIGPPRARRRHSPQPVARWR